MQDDCSYHGKVSGSFAYLSAIANDRRWSGEYKDAKFYKFDVDALPDIAQELGISAMPTFLFFKDGDLDHTIVGANVQKLQETIAALKA
jgi:thioredoxin-like negative regulator of GroEL